MKKILCLTRHLGLSLILILGQPLAAASEDNQTVECEYADPSYSSTVQLTNLVMGVVVFGLLHAFHKAKVSFHEAKSKALPTWTRSRNSQ
jgi:hypothetical protein